MEKRGLGRGLSALIPSGGDAAQEGVRELDIGSVDPNPFQPRTLFDPVKMEDMVASVREHGVLQPVLVRRVGHERYQLIAGERRYRAACAAGLPRLPAIVRECSDQDALQMAVVENLQREDIGVVEAARAYRRLIDEFSLTQDAIARRISKSRSAVANTLRLLSLPEPVLDSLERAEITEGHARALLMIGGEAAIVPAWQTVVTRGLSVRETEALARSGRHGEGRAATSGAVVQTSARGTSDPNETAVAEMLQQRLGTRVRLHRKASGGGHIEIEFYSDVDLERLVELLIGGVTS